MICDNGKHDYLFITSSRTIGDMTGSHEVKICTKCGQFNVFGKTNGQAFNITFTLNSSESVEAAGAYMRSVFKQLEERHIFRNFHRLDEIKQLQIGDNVYANFERENGEVDVRYGVVSDIKGNLVAVDWEIETLESNLYYQSQHIHKR